MAFSVSFNAFFQNLAGLSPALVLFLRWLSSWLPAYAFTATVMQSGSSA